MGIGMVVSIAELFHRKLLCMYRNSVGKEEFGPVFTCKLLRLVLGRFGSATVAEELCCCVSVCGAASADRRLILALHRLVTSEDEMKKSDQH